MPIDVYTISIGSDETLHYTGHYNSITEEYINDATVTAVLLNVAGSTIATVTLESIVDSDGDYRGTLLASTTATLSKDKPYNLRFTAVSDSGTALKYLRCVARWHFEGEE